MTAVFTKGYQFLTPAEGKSAMILQGLMLIGMMLETVAVGLVVPVIAVLVQDGPAVR